MARAAPYHEHLGPRGWKSKPRRTVVKVDSRGNAEVVPLNPSPSSLSPILAASDREHALVAAFLRDHPEYERLGYEAVLQIAETYLDEHEHELREKLTEEGVPAAPYAFEDEADSVDGDDMSARYGSDYA